jgi:GT2 family glycosyltransferase
MKISVVVPTFRRPYNLLRCLEGLKRQELPPDEVLVAVRDDDAATWAALVAWDGGTLPLRLVGADRLGASEARNRCLDRAVGDLLVMTDDDTVPRPEWLGRIHERFAADPALGGLGGPDWIGGREAEPEARATVVGRVQWWGRRQGNHHRGSREAVPVEWLKGANMSFRREALRSVRFGRLLRGDAAQFGEDFAVSLEVASARWKLVYDPTVAVDHFPGVLPGGSDHRALTDPVSLEDASHNETFVLLGYLPPLRRAGFLLWAFAVGTRLLPGALMAGYLLTTRRRTDALQRCRVVWRGRRAGWRTWWTTRTTARSAGQSQTVADASAPAATP